jgi:PAS domain S-box-containing protein
VRAWIGVCQRSYALEVSDRRRFVVSGRLESTVAHPLIWRKDNTFPLLPRFMADVQLLPEVRALKPSNTCKSQRYYVLIAVASIHFGRASRRMRESKSVANDLGNRPNALEQVQLSEVRLRQVIDTIPTLAWCNLADGPNEFLNKRWHEYTGLSPEESNGWGWQAAFHPDDLPSLMEKWRQLLVSGEPGEIEARLRRHDGVFRWFLIRVEPFRDETGKIMRWYGTSTDIEALKQTQEKLREDERELRRITDAIPQTIVVLDPSGAPIYANRATLDYTGLNIEDVVAPDFRERIFHPDDLDRLRSDRKASLERGLPFEAEQRALRRDGEYR